jgi:hypothetical protein
MWKKYLIGSLDLLLNNQKYFFQKQTEMTKTIALEKLSKSKRKKEGLF